MHIYLHVIGSPLNQSVQVIFLIYSKLPTFSKVPCEVKDLWFAEFEVRKLKTFMLPIKIEKMMYYIYNINHLCVI